MKRLFTICTLAVFAFTACQQYGEFSDIKNVPGVDVGEIQDDGTQYVSYRGVSLPDAGLGRSEMAAVLSLIGDQKGDIDDALFEKRLLENVFAPIDRFMKDTENYHGESQWVWAKLMCGAPIFCNLVFADGGDYYIPGEPGCASAGDPAHNYMHEQGIEGWYTMEQWSYDADTDTLTTFDSGFELKAKILYFDGERVVMLGHLGGVASIGWSGSNPDIRVICEEELYLYTFKEGREAFFEALLPYDEYMEMYDSYDGE